MLISLHRLISIINSQSKSFLPYYLLLKANLSFPITYKGFSLSV
jgi:hypothetical protein